MFISYPLNGEVVCAERVARWRPLVNWVLVIPLYLWVAVLGSGAAVVSLVGWFAILFTGQLPERLGDYLVAVLRYQWRVMARGNAGNPISTTEELRGIFKIQ